MFSTGFPLWPPNVGGSLQQSLHGGVGTVVTGVGGMVTCSQHLWYLRPQQVSALHRQVCCLVYIMQAITFISDMTWHTKKGYCHSWQISFFRSFLGFYFVHFFPDCQRKIITVIIRFSRDWNVMVFSIILCEQMVASKTTLTSLEKPRSRIFLDWKLKTSALTAYLPMIKVKEVPLSSHGNHHNTLIEMKTIAYQIQWQWP